MAMFPGEVRPIVGLTGFIGTGKIDPMVASGSKQAENAGKTQVR
jgi:hypothetical protein